VHDIVWCAGSVGWITIAQVGPRADWETFQLSFIDKIVGFSPQMEHFGDFGGFLMFMNEHRRESYINRRSFIVDLDLTKMRPDVRTWYIPHTLREK
jgi:hypothetical protein